MSARCNYRNAFSFKSFNQKGSKVLKSAQMFPMPTVWVEPVKSGMECIKAVSHLMETCIVVIKDKSTINPDVSYSQQMPRNCWWNLNVSWFCVSLGRITPKPKGKGDVFCFGGHKWLVLLRIKKQGGQRYPWNNPICFDTKKVFVKHSPISREPIAYDQ